MKRRVRIGQRLSWHSFAGTMTVTNPETLIQVVMVAASDIVDKYGSECTVRAIAYAFWILDGAIAQGSGRLAFAVMDSEHPGTGALGAMNFGATGETGLGDERIMHTIGWRIPAESPSLTHVQPLWQPYQTVRVARRIVEAQELRALMYSTSTCSIALQARFLIGHGLGLRR